MRSAAAAEGASLALTYQGERLEENVRELAGDARPIRSSCRATSRNDDADGRGVRRRSTRATAASIFSCTARRSPTREDLARPFVETSREGFRKALDVSAYSLVALSRRAAPLMEKRGGGSILTLTYLGSERVFPNYNVMGVAKAALESSVRYLASDLGPKNIRVNAISAGPDQDAGRVRHLRVSRASCRPIAIARRSGARSKAAKSPTPRSSCSGRPAAPSPPKC